MPQLLRTDNFICELVLQEDMKRDAEVFYSLDCVTHEHNAPTI